MQLRIRETAYLMWEAAGQQHGRSLEFWLAAERELLAFPDAERAPTVAEAPSDATAPTTASTGAPRPPDSPSGKVPAAG